MLQYKIPQNVGIEDKIVGPFSLRQLIILAIGGGISYVIFAITSRIYELNALEYFVIAIPFLLALAASLIRIRNVSFTKYVLLTLEFAIKPKKRMWDHRGISALVAPDLTNKRNIKKHIKPEEQAVKANVNLKDLSATLDSGGFANVEEVVHEDIDEATDDDLITEAYFGHKKKESSTENMYWRTKDMQKKKLDILAKMSTAGKKTEVIGISPDKPKRKRNRKKAMVAQPVRQNTQINNTAKNRPAQMIQKPASAPAISAEQTGVQTDQKSAGEKETSLSELKTGSEIEFNLD